MCKILGQFSKGIRWIFFQKNGTPSQKALSLLSPVNCHPTLSPQEKLAITIIAIFLFPKED